MGRDTVAASGRGSFEPPEEFRKNVMRLVVGRRYVSMHGTLPPKSFMGPKLHQRLQELSINDSQHDTSTVAMRDIVSRVAAPSRQRVAYFCVRFCGPRFLDMLRDEVDNISFVSLKAVVRGLRTKHKSFRPRHMFSRSFRPQSTEYLTHKKSTWSAFFKTFKACNRPPKLKIRGQTRRQLCRNIKKRWSGLGAYGAKNWVSMVNFKGGILLGANKTYCESGPGGRAGCNIEFGRPPVLGAHCQSQTTADFYAAEIAAIRRKEKVILQEMRERSGKKLVQAIDSVDEDLQNLEEVQHHNCVGAKWQAYEQTGNVRYTRGYQRRLKEEAAGDEADYDTDFDEEAQEEDEDQASVAATEDEGVDAADQEVEF